MHSIVKACFPNAMITLDRFHHQQFCLEAVQEVCIALRREEMTRVANEREEFRLMLKSFAEKGEAPTDKEGNPVLLNAAYHPEKLENDETRAEILNYFVNRSTNAAAESINAKIKQFRAQLRGIIDKKFLFRLTKIYA